MLCFNTNILRSKHFTTRAYAFIFPISFSKFNEKLVLNEFQFDFFKILNTLFIFLLLTLENHHLSHASYTFLSVATCAYCYVKYMQ